MNNNLRDTWDMLEPIQATTYEEWCAQRPQVVPVNQIPVQRPTWPEIEAAMNTRAARHVTQEYEEALERLVQAALVDRGPNFYDFIMSQIEPEKSQKEPERVESMHFL